MTQKKASSLQEKDGVLQPGTTSKSAAKKIQSNRTNQPSTQDYINGVLQGNVSFLSRAITLIESTNKKHLSKANEILEACLPHANNSIRIGITGVPGVGKSTFIEVFGKHLTSQGKKVAVLAVDPSSSVNKGSILGDKTRMEQLVADENAFIRPSPSGASLGGVAQKTKESILLCEAAGYNTIIIETVGVGQSETMVHSMVDFFLLLKIAGAGDELQGIKRGIIEMADAIVINKADGDNLKSTKIAKTEFAKALHLYPKKQNGWQPKVLTASALHNLGIEEIVQMIREYIDSAKKTGFFNSKRDEQNTFWLESTIRQYLYDSFFMNPVVQKSLSMEVEKLKQHSTTPFAAAQRLIQFFNEQS